MLQHRGQSKTGYANLAEQTPMYLRCIVEHEEGEREHAAQILLDKLWQLHKADQKIEESFLRSIETHVESLREEVRTLRLAVQGGRQN
jgi:hypothetical protein